MLPAAAIQSSDQTSAIRANDPGGMNNRTGKAAAAIRAKQTEVFLCTENDSNIHTQKIRRDTPNGVSLSMSKKSFLPR